MVNMFALLRLLPVSSRDKDTEILALRHQLGPGRVLFTPADPALLAALPHWPSGVLKRLHLVVRSVPCSAGTAISSRVGTPSGPGPVAGSAAPWAGHAS